MHFFYLQSQIDDQDRKIRIQQNIITKYETYSQTEARLLNRHTTPSTTIEAATQTERVSKPYIIQFFIYFETYFKYS